MSSEADAKRKHITPAIESAGWDTHTQIAEEVSFTAGRIKVRGKLTSRGKQKRADYILYYKPNIPIAIVEAKKPSLGVRAGMQQGLEYAEMLDLPFVFSSNGTGFVFHDSTATSPPIETSLSLDEFPSPEQLWEKYKAHKNINEQSEPVVTQDYYYKEGDKTPRYYQVNAINRVVDGIAKGENRQLLVMATGTGKTYTAFQIIWRLWKAGIKKRILFLADRNILVDQTRTNDFKPFGNKMTKITNRKVDTSYEIYLSLYQAVTGTEEEDNIFKEFSPDFFDLVIVDECHRGSAKTDSAWREILKYFSSATQIGMTATPKETTTVSNIDYFGEPVYNYSLKQGIADGFLAPYKVVRYDLNKDLTGWRPEPGQLDSKGNLIEDRIYNLYDFDRNMVMSERTKIVARKVSEFLKASNRFDKTIVFCDDIEHAERMREALVNENSDLVAQNHKYVMQITGDNNQGKAQLDNFIDPLETYPVIATTSKLLTTGVDAKTCKLIVLDQNIRSMTEFKQTIGRGTRVDEKHDKQYFTILDFKRVTELFSDPGFDGVPVQIYEPGSDDPITPPDDEWSEENEEEAEGPVLPPLGGDDEGENTKYYVDDVTFVVDKETVKYMDDDGNLVTESLRDYTRSTVTKKYASLGAFLRSWNEAERKHAIIDELNKHTIPISVVRDDIPNGEAYGLFDLILHVAYGQPPLTRRERAENVKKRNYFAKYEGEARAILEGLLDKYADEGLSAMESAQILELSEFQKFGRPIEIIKGIFGGKNKYNEAFKDLEQALFQEDKSA